MILAFTSLALPEDSVSLNPEPLLVSSRFSLYLKLAVQELDELVESQGFVRMRERSRGDCVVGESRDGGTVELAPARLLLDDSAEKDSVRR